MGYTHYWRQHRDFTADEWAIVRMRVLNILDQAIVSGVDLANGLGEGKPKVGSEEIAFNGRGNDGHETAFFSKKKAPCPEWKSQAEYDAEGAFDFCKTARKPYDPVVVSVLHFLATEFPEVITVSSDGADEGVPVEDSQFYSP
jgi:hypothetical protein